MDGLAMKRVARLCYGEALASEDRSDGDVAVMGSGGRFGSHGRGNTMAPAIVVGRKGNYGATYWANGGAFVTDTAYFIDGRSSSVDLKWLYYVLQAVDLRGVSQDVGVPGLSRDAAHSVVVPVPPPIDEQRRVADFLDGQVVRVDRLLALRRRQLDLTAEFERREIGEYFAKCPSGENTRLKRLLSARPRYGVLVPEFVSDGVPFIRINDLLDLEGRFEDLPKVPIEQSDQYATTIVRPGDVLVSVVGTLGRSTVASAQIAGANVNRAIAIVRVAPTVDPHLMQAWFMNYEFERQAYLATASDSAQPTLGMEDLANFSVRWPASSAEQNAMMHQVNRAHDYAERMNGLLQRQIEVLAERRQALIKAAVTGEIDVSTAREVAE